MIAGREHSESGRILVLTVGFFVVVALLAVAVIDTSAAYLRHRELVSLADSLALFAAEGLDESSVYAAQDLGQDTVRLSPDAAREQVLSRTPSDVQVQMQVSADRVNVRLSREIALPIVPPGWPSTTTITAESTSQLVLP